MKKKYIFSWAIMFLLPLSTALAQYDLVWEDNFDGNSLDNTKWNIESTVGVWNTGDNQELQHYKHENVSVGDDGTGNNCLILTAQREDYKGFAFTSGKVESRGKFSFKYGKIEARIKLPNVGNGLWPAFWLLGHNEKIWPASGEIDIMEAGHAEGIANGTQDQLFGGAVHWEHQDQYAGYGTTHLSSSSLSDDYHIYTLEWSENIIKMYLDGNSSPYYTMDISGDDFEEFKDYPSFILLNLAVGGKFPGIYDPNGITAEIPANMYVDYVKVYQESGKGELNDGDVIIGELSVFSESSSTQKLDIGHDASVNVSVLTENPNTTPRDGEKVLGYTANGSAYELKVTSDIGLNMSRFENGALKFYLKTDVSEDIQVSVTDFNGTKASVTLSSSTSYNVVRDNTWQRVIIPLSEFATTLDFTKVKDFISLEGSTTASKEIALDNVVWTEDLPSFNHLGIFTENPNIGDKLIIDDNETHLYIWQNLTALSGEKSYDGTEVLSFKSTVPDSWYGFGIFSDNGIDLTPFTNGYLHLSLKTTTDANFWVGVGGANNTEGKILFNNDADPYNFIRNGEYQALTIPMADLTANGLDLSACGNVFMFGGEGNLNGIAIDDIYFSANGAVENPNLSTLEQITISSTTNTIRPSEKLELNAKGRDNLGNEFILTPIWTVSDGASINEKGIFEAENEGEYTVTATKDGISANYTVTVAGEGYIPDVSFLGVFSEDTNITEHLIIDNETVHLYIWSGNIAPIDTEAPFEGEQVLSFTDSGDGWFGFGIFSTNGVDLSRFEDGYLNLALKTNSTTDFWLGASGAGGTEAKIAFKNGSDPYGFARDNEYHNISIPMADLLTMGLDLSASENVFMLGGDTRLNGTISIDEIYYSSTNQQPEAPRPIVSIEITAPKTTVKTNEKLQLSAKGIDEEGHDVAITPTWTVSDENATVENGLFVATVVGEYTITATSQEISESITITVEEGDPVDSSTLGIFTEDSNITNNIVIDNETVHLYVWNENITPTDSEAPFEGEEVLSFTDSGDGWFGFGIFSDEPIDLSAYKTGYLNLTLKTNSTTNFWLGTSGANGSEGKIFFNNDENPYGFTRDNKYHSIAIPMADLLAAGLDPSACENIFMLGGDTRLDGTISLDHIYYSVEGTEEPEPEKPLTSIKISAPSTSLTVGQTLQLTAKGFDSDNNEIAITPTWSVSDNGTISETGLFTATIAGSFTVMAKADGVSAEFVITVEDDAITGTEPSLQEQIRFYPVPVSNTLSIDQLPVQKGSISIFNSIGMLVGKMNAEGSTKMIIDFSSWKTGIYFIQIQIEDEIITKKIIKE